MYATDTEVALGEELGYEHSRDVHRGSRFQRGERRVWSTYSGWQTADIINGEYTNHKHYTNLSEALSRALHKDTTVKWGNDSGW
jgi:hypothetical protein